MKTCLETEISALKHEVFGLRSLLMELLDPDYGLKLQPGIRRRMQKARSKGIFLGEQDVLRSLK